MNFKANKDLFNGILLVGSTYLEITIYIKIYRKESNIHLLAQKKVFTKYDTRKKKTDTDDGPTCKLERSTPYQAHFNSQEHFALLLGN
jgi:hypothetical protein